MVFIEIWSHRGGRGGGGAAVIPHYTSMHSFHRDMATDGKGEVGTDITRGRIVITWYRYGTRGLLKHIFLLQTPSMDSA